MMADVNILKMISAISHGIHRNTALNIYKALIKSKLDYSSMVTYISSKNNFVSTQTTQNMALRFVLGLIKSTPINSISNLSGILPRKYQNELNIIKYIIKSKYKGSNLVLTDTKYQKLVEDYKAIQACGVIERIDKGKNQNLTVDTSSISKCPHTTRERAKH